MLGNLITSALATWQRRETRPSSSKLGSYTLGRKLGEGGMGVVYEAEHAFLRRRAAIKMLRAEQAGEVAIARFEREVQVTAGLSHPNIVQVYDCGRSREGFYYAMEYLDGLDLERLVAEQGPQSAERVAHILMQAAEALAEAHAAGVIHRDIKPANLVLCEHARRADVVKVVDFGLVMDISEEATESTDVLEGTPLYMAPEAVTAPEQMDARADIYALGAVGYFLLTGRPPFSGKNVVEVLAQHLHEPVTPPSAHAPVPRELERVILWCLAKSPGARPPSAAALVDALRSSVELACAA